jgi:hypothetical protein
MDRNIIPPTPVGGICATPVEGFSVFEFAIEQHVFDLIGHVKFY